MYSEFIRRSIAEAVRKQSLHVLKDEDFNVACRVVLNNPVNVVPKALKQGNDPFTYKKPKTLFVYPSKVDSKDFLEKTEVMLESIHAISNTVVFEIRGNKKEIVTCFYGEESDLAIIDSSIKNSFPNTFTELGETECETGEFYLFDVIAAMPFYKTLTSYHEFKIVTPLSMIPKLLAKIEKGVGTYQVLMAPIKGDIYSVIKESIDTEWRALQGANNQTPPSLQAGQMNKLIDEKTPCHRSFFAVCTRIILPSSSYEAEVKAFIANYSYGSRPFLVFDNRHYTQEQILEMLNNRVTYHSGFLLNSSELCSLVHVPYPVLQNKEFNEVFASTPVGDKPIIVSGGISIGTWCCGNSTIEVCLPEYVDGSHTHIIGKTGVGKTVLLNQIALNSFKSGKAVLVLDPHGDMTDSLLRMVPRDRVDDVVWIDFGLKDATPQLRLQENTDITNPSKAADDLSESLKDATESREYWGPRMNEAALSAFYILSKLSLNLLDIRLMLSNSPSTQSEK